MSTLQTKILDEFSQLETIEQNELISILFNKYTQSIPKFIGDDQLISIADNLFIGLDLEEQNEAI